MFGPETIPLDMLNTRMLLSIAAGAENLMSIDSKKSEFGKTCCEWAEE